MGTLRFPPIASLVARLRDKFDIQTLVETGTYQGESTSFSADNFSNVITIDIREDFQNEAKARCERHDNILFLHGDTRSVLPAIVDGLKAPALFWLDAHSVKDMFGPTDDCPILEELDIINRHHLKHFILIDDAHCFKPPVPHDAAVWPEITAIYDKATEGGYIVGEAHDVIVIVPATATRELATFIGAMPPPSNHASAVIHVKAAAMMSQNVRTAQSLAEDLNKEYQEVMSTINDGNTMTLIAKTVYGKVLCPRYDVNQTPPLCSGHALDHGNINLLIGLIKDRQNPVFVDIGANVGTFSFAMQPHCREIFAFEAQRIIFNMFCGSVALNGWENVFAFNVALNDKLGELDVPRYDYNKSLSFGSIEFDGKQREPLAQLATQSVEKVLCAPLDNFKFKQIDLLKIDVEGMEARVLAGARETIKQHRPIIFIEYSKSDPEELWDFLTELQYEIHDCGSDYLAFPI